MKTIDLNDKSKKSIDSNDKTNKSNDKSNISNDQSTIKTNKSNDKSNDKKENEDEVDPSKYLQNRKKWIMILSIIKFGIIILEIS